MMGLNSIDCFKLTEDEQSNRFANINTFSMFSHTIVDTLINLKSDNTEQDPTIIPDITDEEENTGDEEDANNDEESTGDEEDANNDEENTGDEEDANNDEESTGDEEDANDEESHVPSITYTANPNNANRVMANNCDKLSCGDYTKAESADEIVFCSEFIKNVDLEPDAARV